MEWSEFIYCMLTTHPWVLFSLLNAHYTFITLFNKYLLCASDVPGIFVGTQETRPSKTGKGGGREAQATNR